MARVAAGRSAKFERSPMSKRRAPCVVVCGVQDQGREVAGIGALDPVFFQWASAVPPGSDVQQADGIRSKQPLIAGGDGEIRLHVTHAEGERAERLRQIERERGADLTASLADADQIEPPAARPLHVGKRGDRNLVAQGSQDRGRPVVVFRPGDDFQNRSLFFRQPLPWIVVGRKLLGEHENTLSLTNRQIPSCRRGAVARGGNNGDAVGGAIKYPSSRRPKLFRAGEELIGRDLPGVCFARQAGLPRLDHRPHQRRHVGAVEVGDVVGDIEEMALAGKHGMVCGHQCINRVGQCEPVGIRNSEAP